MERNVRKLSKSVGFNSAAFSKYGKASLNFSKAAACKLADALGSRIDTARSSNL